MILKRLSFPIFLLITLFLSCNEKKQKEALFSNQDYKVNINFAEKWLTDQKYDSAYFYYEKAKITAINSDQKVYALLQLAAIQKHFCDFSEMESTVTEAYKNVENSKYLPYIYNLLGIAYQEQHNYEEALNYYNKCFNDSLSDLNKCIFKNNIAVVYLEKRQYKKAADILLNTITVDSLIVNKLQYAKNLSNLGFALFKLNQPQAVDYLNQSLKIRDSINDYYELATSYVHLADYYQKKNSQLAFEFANKAYQASHKTNSPDDELIALKIMIANSEPNTAKELALQQIHLSDSITKARQIAKNQFAKIKFDSKKATKELERQKQLKEYFILGIVLLTGLAIFIYYRIKISNRKKIEETAYRTETRIAKRLHDELANDVHNAIAFAETQNLENPLNKEALLENLDTIYSRTRNISGENRDIDTGENYLEKLKAMMASYNTDDRNVIVNVDGFQHQKTSKEIKVAIHRVFQELLVNMKKHSQCTLVGISIKTDKNRIEATYSDNGIGTSNLLNLKNGLQNAENRIHSLKGTITFDTEPNKGFKVKITIPN
ncbi:tetratricopeptide repeat-containing sensor histidine kinase [Flavobacterium solisilvae]|uniref:histidine kinase n=1 Tax=Flavobacterium solisilvae TaxID=1852019 RepID=A0ABX1QR91_9FLAO|nr:tetratricopeptide repeat-containing sensor histidine kinase [Flavobacterium solisilvae]NMH24341.1 tetratricopeptide repeat protein [Flavobacterium solisilvae]